MKKLLITVCLSGLLSVPSTVLGAEMAGASLYGSFRTGLNFGSGIDASVMDFGSRWGIKGSHEVAEGLTASYQYEGKINTTNAEFGGGAGHSHDYNFVDTNGTVTSVPDMGGADPTKHKFICTPQGNPYSKNEDGEYEATKLTDDVADTNAIADVDCGHLFNKTKADGGQGGRLSSVSLSGGFGTVSLGQIWAASAIHYGFAVDGSYWNGTSGGASGRQGTTVSYSSSAGDVSFQIDKVTGNDDVDEKLEFGVSASLGPVGVGLGYWSNADDDASFTGVAISAGAAGVNLTIGLSSEDDTDGKAWDANHVRIAGTAGDTGLSYSVQLTSADKAADDKNVLILTNSLGAGASLIFEHADPGKGDSSSLLALVVDF